MLPTYSIDENSPTYQWTSIRLDLQEIGTASTPILREQPEQFIYLCLAWSLPNKERDRTDLFKHSCFVLTVAIASYCTASLWKKPSWPVRLDQPFYISTSLVKKKQQATTTSNHQLTGVISSAAENQKNILTSPICGTVSPQTFLKSHFRSSQPRRPFFHEQFHKVSQ